ncbi:MAG: TetR/AcrR family transcriptional regulator [Solirubrobacterales bacterium]
MTRREPVQKRSRQRVEQILLASADLLAKSGKPEDLTTTSVSKRSGVPVATIYRYFTDRSAIIAALIDRETDEIDIAIAAELKKLEVVTVDILFNTIMRAHYTHFKTHRRAIVLWFGARQSATVLERVERRYKEWGDWCLRGWQDAGLIVNDAPDWGGEAIFWFSDRAFEFIFRTERSDAEEEEILTQYLEMTSLQLRNYVTQTGIEGLPRDEFFAKAGDFPPNDPAVGRDDFSPPLPS